MEKFASFFIYKSFIHSGNFFIIRNVYLLMIRGNWFCFIFNLKAFLAGYVEYIPRLQPYLVCSWPWSLTRPPMPLCSWLKFQVTPSQTTASLSIHLLTFRLFPCLGYCKQCCSEHWGICILPNHEFL